MFRFLSLAWLAAAVVAPLAAHGNPLCKAPRVLVLLDKSSSMTETVGAKSKWSIATEALTTVLTTYQQTIDFGLMIFPDPNQCSPGKVLVPVGPNNASAILGKLGVAPPQYGNYTPMAQTLDVAAVTPGLQDPGYSNHVLLITDGYQYCYPYDASTRFLPVNAVGKITAMGIKTHVVGFGDAVDALVLNKMAAAANNKIAPGCDVTGTDPKSGNNCYYQANSPQQLLDALKKIAKSLSDEVCDGIDNDCNGTVDDLLNGKAPPCANQIGVCQGATAQCGGMAGWLACNPGDYQAHAHDKGTVYQAAETLCDGVDNDCDGTVDEGCTCKDGDQRPCGSDLGACVKGVQLCAGGSWGGCAGEVTAVAEACDGVDNDCDGKSDEDLARSCTTICGVGQQVCENGAWGACDAPSPTQEICDGQDNDCDGTVDGPDAYCEEGVCVDGTCQAQDPGTDPPLDVNAGCDCDLSRGPGPTPVALALTLIFAGLILLLARRPR